MNRIETEVIVAGHICLDVIPSLAEHQGKLDALLSPGKLVKIGPAVVSTGGAVSNTGVALHRLGVATRLMGKVGDDTLGRAILDVLRGHGKALADQMIIAPGGSSSYTLVINPPNVDRMFLHCPGVNDTFCADDIPYDKLTAGQHFHFGYPPLMRRMYLERGQDLEAMFRRVKARGLTTSLDMVMPDPKSEAGRVDWASLLSRVLPHVDYFLPSLDEMLLMLRRPAVEPSGALLSELSAQLQRWGATVVALKLGDQGLYCRWPDRELLAPCFEVDVVGTTGSGDCTIAGFLAAMRKGRPITEVMTMAVAVGACCCEAADALSSVRSWEEIQARIGGGWNRKPVRLPLEGWTWNPDAQLWFRKARS